MNEPIALHADLRPLIEACIVATLEKLRPVDDALTGRLSLSEPEAAAVIGIAAHGLRDCRLRGEISGGLIGKRIFYSAEELRRFVAERTGK